MPRAALIVLLCVLPVACGEPRLDAPEPQVLEPASVQVGTSVEVVIRGRHFLPLVEADYGDRERSQVDGAFRVRLGEHALEDVTFVSTTELRGRVPAELARGRYSLVVVGPGGDEGRLADAFEVRGRPAWLAVESSAWTVEAGECSAPVVFEARDAEGLDGPVDVELTVSPAEAVSLYADDSCGERITSVRLEAPAFRRTVFFRGTRAGGATLTATSSLGTVERKARVLPGPAVNVVWDEVSSPQQAGVDFGVSARALDAFDNLTDAGLNPSLEASSGEPPVCRAGCNPNRRPEFVEGLFRGTVRVNAPARGLRLRLMHGNRSWESGAFDVTVAGGSPGRGPGGPARLLEPAPERGGRTTW